MAGDTSSDSADLQAVATAPHRVRKDTLLSGLLAACAAIAGAAVGGVATYYVASAQIHAQEKQSAAQVRAQQEQSRADFLRAQQRDAYVAFISDAATLASLQYAYGSSIAVNSPQRSSAGQLATDQLNKVFADQALISMVGSTWANDAANNLVAEFIKNHNVLINGDIKGDASAGNARSSETGVISLLETKFEDVARADLQGK